MGLLFGSSDDDFGTTEQFFSDLFREAVHDNNESLALKTLYEFIKYRLNMLEKLIKEEKLI